MAYINFASVLPVTPSYGRVRSSKNQKLTGGEYLAKDELQLFHREIKGEFIASVSIETMSSIATLGVGYNLTFLKNFAAAANIDGKDAIIAGGSVVCGMLGIESPDIDIYFSSLDSLRNMIPVLENAGYFVTELDRKLIKDDPSSLKFIQMKPTGKVGDSRPLQLIKMSWCDPAYEHIKYFDLTCSQFAISKDFVFYTAKSLEHFNKRLLIPNVTLYPVSTIKRIVKYAGRGFKMLDGNVSDIAKLFGNISQHEASDDGKADFSNGDHSDNLWSNPDYRKDYYEMETEAFKRKWE